MIPKEAPWKTSALSKQPEKGCALSTATSGTERERGFVGTFLPSLKRNYEIFVKSYISSSFYIIGPDPGCPILGVPGLFTTRIC